jgi:voltage-gated potassium channel
VLFLESYKGIYDENKRGFYYIELSSIIIFSIEYILRTWTADLANPKLPAYRARINYICSFMGLVDLIAILPFYLPYLFKIDLRIVRVLRLFRLLRILKLTRHHRSINLIIVVIKKTKSDILSTLFIVLILLVLSSTIMYYLENEAQPDQFTDIGQAFWWAIATLTTVGYGDIYPVTGLGKILSSSIALLGIGIVALPTGIISSAYIQEVQKEAEPCNCPHCGKEI